MGQLRIVGKDNKKGETPVATRMRSVGSAIGEFARDTLDVAREPWSEEQGRRVEAAVNLSEVSFPEVSFLWTFLKDGGKQGDEKPTINESYYKKEDLAFLKEKVLAESKRTGKTKGRFDQYENAWGVEAKEINKRPVWEGFVDQNVRMARTLGKANWEVMDDGTVVITDTYNFNSGGYVQGREGLRGLLKTGKWPSDIPEPSFEQMRNPMFWLNGLAYNIQEDRREKGLDPDIPVRIQINGDV